MSDVPDYFADRSHWLVSGVSGSRTRYGGKSALAAWFAHTQGGRFDVVLVLNFKRDEQFRGVRCATVDEVADAMAAGHREIVLTPETPDWQAVHENVQAFVRALPDDQSMLVVHDEAPEYVGDSLRWFVRVAGNGCNVKSLVLAQSPADLPMAVRRQCLLVWVGPATSSNLHVIEANDYGAHADHLRNQDPYHWSVLLGPETSDRDEFAPVPAEYAEAP